jgi:hypothetical protein
MQVWNCAGFVYYCTHLFRQELRGFLDDPDIDYRCEQQTPHWGSIVPLILMVHDGPVIHI